MQIEVRMKRITVCVNRNRRWIDEKNAVELRSISWINKSNTTLYRSWSDENIIT